MDDSSFIHRTLLMISGLLIWAVQFGFVYTVTALACVRGFAGVEVLGIGIVPLAVVAATVASLALTAALMALPAREMRPTQSGEDIKPVDTFLTYTTVTIGALSLIAIALTGLPVLIVPACE